MFQPCGNTAGSSQLSFKMKAWQIHHTTEIIEGARPLVLVELPDPVPGPEEVLIRISVCGVCHTELDEIEGRTPPSVFPMIPGHQVVGRIERTGEGPCRYAPGDRVGVAWIYSSCGNCDYCQHHLENLCSEFKATGRDHPGGYAEYMIARQDFCFPIPSSFEDNKAAPLFCAGAIGYRSLNLTGISNGMTLGLAGFGASAHLVMKMVSYKYPDTKVFVFARSEKELSFARELGAAWCGNFDSVPPSRVDAVIDTTPAWKPVIRSLAVLKPGGRLVINAIRKESRDLDALQQISYPEHLWMEKEIKSVANVTRNDVSEFLNFAGQAHILPETEDYSFMDANQALIDLKQGKSRGAKILLMT